MSVEREILSACMLTNENMLIALESGVIPDWFEERGHRKIFAELTEVAGRRIWTERDGVVCLQAEKLFDRHPDALDMCANTPDWAFSAEELKNAIDVLRSEHAHRRLMVAANHALHALGGGRDPFDVADSLKHDIDVVNEASPNEHITTRDIAREAYRNDDAVSRGECVGLPFPWESFQRKTFGIPLKALTPLAGRDGKGKSRLATYLAHHWLSLGYGGLYFPFEDSAHRFMSNLAASHGQYDMFTIRRGYVPPGFMDRHSECLDAVSRFPLVVSDTPSSVERIVSKIANAKRSHDIRFVVIDGIKDIIPPHAESQTVGEDSMNAALVRAAKEYNIAIIPCLLYTSPSPRD